MTQQTSDKLPVRLTLKMTLSMIVVIGVSMFYAGCFVTKLANKVEAVEQSQKANNESQEAMAKNQEVMAKNLALMTVTLENLTKKINEHCDKDNVLDAGDVRDGMRDK